MAAIEPFGIVGNRERQALRNAYRLVDGIAPGASLTREQILAELRRPLPPVRERESDAVILHSYRQSVSNAGIAAGALVTYAEAQILTGKTYGALTSAAYQKRIVSMDENRDGKIRRAVTLASLADWLKWTPEQRAEAVDRLKQLQAEG